MRLRGYYGSGYAGANFSVARSMLRGMVADHAREFTTTTRRELVRKARYFKKNVGMLRGMGKGIVDHAIGPGVYPLPAAKDPRWSEADLDAWNARAWDFLQNVAKIAEVSGRMTLWEVQRARTDAKYWEGELFTLHFKSATGWPQLQLIRGHNCDNFEVKETDGWADGVQTNDFNRPLNYRFKLKGEKKYATVAAKSVVHSYLLEDPDQVRGVTPLAHCLNDVHDILDTLSLEKDSVKDLSRTSRVITTASGEDEEPESGHFNDEGGGGDGDIEGVKLERIFSGAEIQRLRTGEKLESFRSERPSPTFTGFIDYLGRGASVGAGFPYEFAWAANELKGPGVRYVLEKVRVGCDMWRRNEIEDTLPFITFALSCGIDLGELSPAPSDWWRLEWIGGAEDVTIDKARDANQDRENIKAALDSFKRYFARRGLWWKTELQQKASEAAYIDALAKKYGVSADRIHLLLTNPSAEQPAGKDKRADDPDDEREKNAA